MTFAVKSDATNITSGNAVAVIKSAVGCNFKSRSRLDGADLGAGCRRQVAAI